MLPLVAVAIAIAFAQLRGLQGWSAVGGAIAAYIVAIVALRVIGPAELRLLRSMFAGGRTASP